MSSSKITLFTFAKWMQQYDKDLFKELSVPAGIEKDVLVDNILLRGGEFEVVYSDPDFMQYAIGSWSRKWYRTMERWIKALSIDYHPLENYDRYETFQDDTDKSNNMDRTLDHADTLTINTQDLLTLGSQDKVTHNTEDKTLINTKDLRTLNTKNKETKDLEDINLRNLKDEEIKNLTDEEIKNLRDEEVKNLKDSKTTEGEVVNLKNLQDVDVIDSTETTTYDHTTTSEQLVSAYDSSSYQPSAKTINTDGEASGGGLNHNTVTLDRDSTETINRTGTERANNTGSDVTDYTGTDTTNRTGTDTINRTGTDTTNRTGTESATHTGTDTTENTGTDTLDKTGTETTGRTGTETTDHSGTETTGRTGTEITGHTGTISDVGGETAKSVHVGHTHGNIGITSSQQLLESELSISKWNIYENITDLFLTEFVIPIYT